MIYRVEHLPPVPTNTKVHDPVIHLGFLRFTKNNSTPASNLGYLAP